MTGWLRAGLRGGLRGGDSLSSHEACPPAGLSFSPATQKYFSSKVEKNISEFPDLLAHLPGHLLALLHLLQLGQDLSHLLTPDSINIINIIININNIVIINVIINILAWAACSLSTSLQASGPSQQLTLRDTPPPPRPPPPPLRPQSGSLPPSPACSRGPSTAADISVYHEDN